MIYLIFLVPLGIIVAIWWDQLQPQRPEPETPTPPFIQLQPGETLRPGAVVEIPDRSWLSHAVSHPIQPRSKSVQNDPELGLRLVRAGLMTDVEWHERFGLFRP